MVIDGGKVSEYGTPIDLLTIDPVSSLKIDRET
jgi:hypothetical protein